MSATANPYTAPDAELGTGTEAATYEPGVFTFKGRIGRMRYLVYGMGIMMLMSMLAGVLAAVMIPAAGAAGDAGGMIGMLLMALIYAGVLVIAIMFGKRRLNDLNRSGWWYLLTFVPIANIGLAIYMLFFPGSDGANNFGPAPAPNSTAVTIVGWLVIALFAVSIVAAIAVPAMMGMPQ